MDHEDTYYWNGPLPETQAPATTPEPWGETKVVGKPIVRVDAFDRVSGTAIYPSDVSLPDMLHAAILTCPHAHAIAKKVDTSEAEKMPGVRAVLKDGMAGTNIPWFAGGGGFASRLFDPHARYQGEEVAAVAADTIYQAWDAIRAIKVEWDVQGQVTTVEDAIKPDAPKVRDDGNKPAAAKPFVRGDVAAGFKAAEVVVEHTFTTPCELHSPMELHGCVAKWDGHHLTIWESTQGVYAVQSTVARALNLPLANVRAIGHYVGGGFGAKLDTGKYSVIAALLARKTRRPVRLFLSREQTAQSQGNRPGSRITIKLGARKDGTLVALQSSAIGSGGAYAGAGNVDYVMRELYACPNVLCEGQSVYIHAGPQRAFRAPGHPQGAWALEGAMDALAAKLGMDPIDLRRKNFSATSQLRNNIPYTSNGLLQCYEEGAKAFGWKAARSRPAQPGHLKRGVGVAAGMWQGGNGGPPATIIVKLFGDGSANLNMGASDIGCGTKTWAAQIVAEELGVPVEKISIEHADTGTTQFATPSGGSKTVPTESPAIRAAALDVKQQLLAMAAEQLKVPAADLELRGSEVVSKADPAKKVELGRIQTFSNRGLLVGVGYRGPNPQGKATNPFGVQFAEVEVNTRTGEVKVLRFLAAHDSGRIMNAKTFQNQVFGGVTMGIGLGLTEDRVLDHKQLGKLLTGNLHDYKLPTALDAPADKSVVVVDPRDTECNTTGAKGVGEPATIPTAPAIANAVYHAIGVRLTDAPMSPARVLQALSSASQPAPKGRKGGE